MRCRCSAKKGQCRLHREQDIYNAGIRAGYLKRQVELEKPLQNIQTMVDEIIKLCKKD